MRGKPIPGIIDLDVTKPENKNAKTISIAFKFLAITSFDCLYASIGF